MFCYLYFSCFGKKSTKRSRVKGALRTNAPPLYNPPAASLEARNKIGRAARASAAAKSKTVQRYRHVVKVLRALLSAPRVGYIGEGVSGARERGPSASPMPLSLSLSCADTRK